MGLETFLESKKNIVGLLIIGLLIPITFFVFNARRENKAGNFDRPLVEFMIEDLILTDNNYNLVFFVPINKMVQHNTLYTKLPIAFKNIGSKLIIQPLVFFTFEERDYLNFPDSLHGKVKHNILDPISRTKKHEDTRVITSKRIFDDRRILIEEPIKINRAKLRNKESVLKVGIAGDNLSMSTKNFSIQYADWANETEINEYLMGLENDKSIILVSNFLENYSPEVIMEELYKVYDVNTNTSSVENPMLVYSREHIYYCKRERNKISIESIDGRRANVSEIIEAGQNQKVKINVKITPDAMKKSYGLKKDDLGFGGPIQ